MISRRTLLALVLAVGVGLCIFAWRLGTQDACEAYLQGDTRAPEGQVVGSGSGAREVPCAMWLPRQPVLVQAAVLGDVALAVLFVGSAMVDWKRRGGRGW